MAYSRHAPSPGGSAACSRAFGVQDEAPVWLAGGQRGDRRTRATVLKPFPSASAVP